MLKMFALFCMTFALVSFDGKAHPNETQPSQTKESPSSPISPSPTEQQRNGTQQGTEKKRNVDADVRVVQTPEKDLFDKAAFWVNFALAIVTALGVLAYYLTLRVLRKQQVIMNQQVVVAIEAATTAQHGVSLGIEQVKIMAAQIVEMRSQTAVAQASADAALLNTKTFINAERPWILVKAEPSKRWEFGWELIAVNKGRTPAAIVAQADNCMALSVMSVLPDIAKYGKSKIYPTPQIILPDEPFTVGDITQYSLFKNDRAAIHRFRNVETEGYVFGSIIYRDLLSPPTAEPHETRWCFSILPWKDQGILLTEHGWGGNEYTRHT